MRIAHQGSGVQRQAVIDQTIGKPGRDTKIKIKNLNSIVKEEHGSRNGMVPRTHCSSDPSLWQRTRLGAGHTRFQF